MPRSDGHVRDAVYVLDILDELIGTPASREHRFDWLRGDPSAAGRQARLPVDAYWPELRLVVEVYERQHDEVVPHFHKVNRMTVSGVHRGEQRKVYDERRRVEVPAHGLRLLVIRTRELACTPRGRLLRDRSADVSALRSILAAEGIMAPAIRPVS